ncbi:MAG: sodium:proton antiporter [Defluviitaleaceae bacterium]|nr:sodium:proton antiporter [Defluviitaleaceae bacterium]
MFNPVILAVILMCVLCLLKFNVMIAIIVSAIFGGLIAGLGLDFIMVTFIGGMSGSNQVALSYILLGTLAFGISDTGLAGKFANSLEKIFGKTGKIFIIVLTFVACLSQNVIPIHIAFIPILVPPLLKLMNKLKLDRRMAACALTFGLKAPYIIIPMGFGAIFHNILAENMAANGMPIDAGIIPSAVALPVLGMFVGLLISFFVSYRKPREYEDLPLITETKSKEKAEETEEGFTIRHWGALIGAVTAAVVQLVARQVFGGAAMWAMPLGTTLGILIMLATGAIQFKKFDHTVKGGIQLMGFIAFVMLVASGFGAVIRETGGVDYLVYGVVPFIEDSRLLAVLAMLFIGLFITMGIGTSFGTVPIIAVIYVPLAAALGFSTAATVALIATAGAMGDAGSPASDSTLGPTAGLSADGQHNHIWDTCVPTFLHFDIPLFIFGAIAAMIL